MLSLLKEQAEGQVLEAWTDIRDRGPGWLSRLKQGHAGHAGLARVAPELDIPDWLTF